MKAERIALARHRLERPRTTLDEGERLLEHQAAAGAVNRFYYAAFYAARALLALRELDSARHRGVISLFQTHLVKTGELTSEVARALPRAFEKRLKTDYGDFATISEDEARQVRDEVQTFVGACVEVFNRLAAAP